MTISNITYLDQLQTNRLFLFSNPSITRFYFQDYLELKQFLNNLEVDKTYIITFDFIMSWLLFEEDSPVISLSKPILITKNSNPRLISDFIKQQIRLACDNYYLDESIMDMMIDQDGPGIIVKYNQINLF
jgi:hypothetical protein